MFDVVDFNAHAEAKLVDTTVAGKLLMKNGAYPTFDTSYDYLPEDDPKRTTPKPTKDMYARQAYVGVGIVHDTDEHFTLKGSFYREIEEDFSLFLVNLKESSHTIDTMRVMERFRFRFGLIGAQVDWDEEAFDTALFTFPSLAAKGSFHKDIMRMVKDDLIREGEKGEDNPEEDLLIGIHMNWSQGGIVWSVELEEGILLEQILILEKDVGGHKTADTVFSVSPSVGFRIVSQKPNLSAKAVWHEYIEPISKLLSLALGGKMSPGEVYLESQKNKRDCILISEEIDASNESGYKTYLDPGALSPDDFKSWLSKFKEFEYFINLLIRVFPEKGDFLILGSLLSQLESLHKKISDINAGINFRTRLESLIDEWENKSRFFNDELNTAEVAERILNLRNIITHEALDQSQLSKAPRDAEMLGIFEFAKLLYLATIMRFFNIEWEYRVENDLSGNGLLSIGAAFVFKQGHMKWSALD